MWSELSPAEQELWRLKAESKVDSTPEIRVGKHLRDLHIEEDGEEFHDSNDDDYADEGEGEMNSS